MIKHFLSFVSFIFILSTLKISAQIAENGNSVQVISYWDLNQKEKYRIEKFKYKIKGNDTLTTNSYSYDVMISVIDSTANSYDIQWDFSNYKINVQQDKVSALDIIPEGFSVKFRTDENGMITSFLNTEEIRKGILNQFDQIKSQISSNEQMNNLLEVVSKKYTSNESVESLMFKDIHIYHIFHGGMYVMGEEYKDSQEIYNMHGKNYLADISVNVKNINLDEYFSVLEYNQTIPKEQLKESTLNYLKSISEAVNMELPEQEIGLDNLNHSTYIASAIHDSGWVMYLYKADKIVIENIETLEELTIEIILD